MDAADKIDALARLIESPGWRVLTDELRDVYNRHSVTLRSVTDTDDIGAVRHLQGALSALDRCLKMPDKLIRELHEERHR